MKEKPEERGGLETKGKESFKKDKCHILAVFTDAQYDDSKTVTEIL